MTQLENFGFISLKKNNSDFGSDFQRGGTSNPVYRPGDEVNRVNQDNRVFMNEFFQ